MERSTEGSEVRISRESIAAAYAVALVKCNDDPVAARRMVAAALEHVIWQQEAEQPV